MERLEYIRWVDSVLQKHRGTEIDQLKVCFDLDWSTKFDIEDWVIFAMKKRVQKLELDFLTFCNAESPKDVSLFYTSPLEDLEL